MTNISSITVAIVCTIIFMVGLVLGSRTQPTFGADATQVAANFASSTAQVVTATANTISATSTGCTSRNISTAQQGIMLTFDDSKTPTGSFGTWQAASTTVTYDAGQWGCGAIKALSGATANVTVSVFR